jgi:hypothetical protein
MGGAIAGEKGPTEPCSDIAIQFSETITRVGLGKLRAPGYDFWSFASWEDPIEEKDDNKGRLR